MKLLTKELLEKLPEIGSQEGMLENTVLYAKFFTPWTNWTWYVAEYSLGDRIFYGYVDGHEGEWGYFSLDELEEIKGPGGLKIERDRFFKETTYREMVNKWKRVSG